MNAQKPNNAIEKVSKTSKEFIPCSQVKQQEKVSCVYRKDVLMKHGNE